MDNLYNDDINFFYILIDWNSYCLKLQFKKSKVLYLKVVKGAGSECGRSKRDKGTGKNKKIKVVKVTESPRV